MPIYEFECGKCETLFESLVDAGTETADCPECGADQAQRRMSQFGVVTRQLTPRQQRRMEDARGANRGGARERWQTRLDRARAKGGAEKNPNPGGKKPK